MLPDLRFAIGAMLAGALVIVMAFGLAATVRMAHHRTAGPADASRLPAYAVPADWSDLATEPRQFPVVTPDAPDDHALPDRVAVIDTGSDPGAGMNTGDREFADEAKAADPGEQVAALDSPPVTINLTTPAPLTADHVTTPPDAERPAAGAQTLEPSEHAAALPSRPTAKPGFAPQQAATAPTPTPRARPAAKKKKMARRRFRARPPELPPHSDAGFPVLDLNKPWFFD